MRKYKCYFDDGVYIIKNYKKLLDHLKRDRNKHIFLEEVAFNYNMFKSLLKMKNLKLIKFSYEDGMEEEHIRFVDRLRKDIPIMERYIEKTRLK